MSILHQPRASGDLAVIAAHLDNAVSPEQVFGELSGSMAEQLDRLHRLYRQLALGVHPDRHGNDPVAHDAFVALQRFYLAAQVQVRDGRFGQHPDPATPVVITTRRRTYTVGAPLAAGDLAALYTCTVADRLNPAVDPIGCILKVARDAQDNDLLANEARALRHLATATDGRPVPAYIPRLLEMFRYQDDAGHARQVNAFPLTGALPPRVPSPIQTYLQSALWTGAARTDAGQLYRDFADLLADLWGRRRFMPFAMPARR